LVEQREPLEVLLEVADSLGGEHDRARVDQRYDSRQIALFWVESSPLQWNRIARTVSAATGIDA
jgi:hypothetical protein